MLALAMMAFLLILAVVLVCAVLLWIKLRNQNKRRTSMTRMTRSQLGIFYNRRKKQVKKPKIILIGCSCAGKSTLTDALFKHNFIRDNYNLIQMDEIRFEKDWRRVSGQEFVNKFVSKLEEGKDKEGWIVDGNYHIGIEKHTFYEADVVIYLDYPFWTVFLRGLKRSIMRSIFRLKSCNGNQESLYNHLFGDKNNSIPKFIWYQYKNQRWRQRIKKFRRLSKKSGKNVVWINLKSPEMTKQWLAEVDKTLRDMSQNTKYQI